MRVEARRSPPASGSRFYGQSRDLARLHRPYTRQNQLPVPRLKIQPPLRSTPRHQYALFYQECCDKYWNPSRTRGSDFDRR